MAKRTTYDIFVGNLPQQADEKSVGNLFAHIGEIKQVYVKEGKKEGQHKIAFVKFLCEEDAENSIKLRNGYVWEGTPINVCRAFGAGNKFRQGQGIPGSGNNELHTSSMTKTLLQHDKVSFQQLSLSDYQYDAPNPSASNIDKNQQPGVEDLLVCHIVSPVMFFAHRPNQMDELLRILNELAAVCPTSTPISVKPDKLTTYASIFSEDHQWYRCHVVKHVNENQCLVHYIDYGNREVVENSRIVPLPPHLQTLPPLALKCLFMHLEAVKEDNQKLFNEAIHFLKILTEGNIVKAQLKPLPDGTTFVLAECTVSGVNLSQELLNNGFAKPHNPKPKQSSMFPSTCSMPNFKQTTLNSLPDLMPRLDNSLSKPFRQKERVQEDLQLLKEKLFILQDDRDRLHQELAHERGRIEALQKEREILIAHKLNSSIVHEELQETSPACIFKIPDLLQLIEDVEKVRSLRSRLSLGEESSDAMEEAISVIDKKFPDILDKHFDTEKAWGKYMEHLNAIKQCSSELPPAFTEKRMSSRQEFYQSAEIFLQAAKESPLEARIMELKKTISSLEQNYAPFLKAVCNCSCHLPTEELTAMYQSLKNENKEAFQKTRTETEMRNNEIINILQSLQQALNANPTTRNRISESSKNFLSPSYVEACMMEFRKSLQNEIRICDLEVTPAAAAVITMVSCEVHSSLSEELKTLEHLPVQVQKYCQRSASVQPWLNSTPDANVEKLHNIQKDIKGLKSKLRHKLADKHDLDENEDADAAAIERLDVELAYLKKELHQAYLKEDRAMAELSQLQETHFPELDVQYPELGLSSYMKYRGLVKHGWDLEHFLTERIDGDGVVYRVTSVEPPVLLKEYLIDAESTKERFLENIIRYSQLNCETLLPVQAVFFSKNGRMAWVQFPCMQREQLSGNKRPILTSVLKGLEALHGAGMVHGCVHPYYMQVSTKGAVVRGIVHAPDFTKDEKQKSHVKLPVVNGLSFQPPEVTVGKPLSTASDMFNFGSLMLWLLLPEKMFTELATTVPNLSEINMAEEVPVSHDVFQALFHREERQRPTAQLLLQMPYFSKS